MPEPTAEACKRRDELSKAQWTGKRDRAAGVEVAFAFYIDAVSRAAREVEDWLDKVGCQSGHKTARERLRSLMLPDPQDPLVEAIRKAILTDAHDEDAKRLRDELAKRFKDAADRRWPKGSYLPFGAGPRVCPGNYFGMLEGQLVLATIAQRYRLSRRGKPTKAEALVTLRPKGAVWMNVERSAFAAKAEL